MQQGSVIRTGRKFGPDVWKLGGQRRTEAVIEFTASE
jgi:hypothetical protein